MKIFNWVHRKINGQHIHEVTAETQQKDCGNVSFNYWQNGLLCIGTLGGDDQNRVHPQQEEEKEEEYEQELLQHKHEDENEERHDTAPVVLLEVEDEDDDITVAEVEMFKKSLAKILGIGDEMTDTNNHYSPRPRENFNLCEDPDGDKTGYPLHQNFPLEEFLEIPVSSTAMNSVSEKEKKKKKKRTLAKNALGTLLFSKKQKATDEKSNGEASDEKSYRAKASPVASVRKADYSMVDKILHWKKKRSVSVSSAPQEALPYSRFSKFKSMLKEKGGRALKKGEGKDEAEKAYDMSRSGPLLREAKHIATFSSSSRSDTYPCQVQERDTLSGHEEDYISLSRDHSLGRIQEYWIKTNSEFVVLEL